MQAANAEQNMMNMAPPAPDSTLRDSKRRRAERLLSGREELANAGQNADEQAKKMPQPQSRDLAGLQSLRRAQSQKVAEKPQERAEENPRKSEEKAAPAVKAPKLTGASTRQALRSAELAAPKKPEPQLEIPSEVKPAPVAVTAPAARRRRSVWSFGVWFSGHDWVRFAVSAVAILMVGQVLSLVAAATAHANTRIKDIVAVEGVRDNMLIGYGLVVGLDGTGDKLKNSAFTGQSLAAFLERLGVNTRDTELKTKNVAAVTVTATLPPFARQGSRIDVSVSAMGDAQSLQGGTLLASPLYAADGQVYAVAQGAVAIGGFTAGGEASAITKGVPTSAAIANGAIVEREVAFELNDLPSVDLALRNPDVTTATRIAAVINDRMGAGSAVLRDPATVRVAVPEQYRDNITMLLARIEQLPVETDQIARVVVDEATGTIVMGENVRIDTVAVAQGNLIVKVQEAPLVSQPGAFAPPGAETVVVPRTNVAVDEEEANQMVVLNRGATLNELVAGLNALGVGPRDLITILQTIKAAGALQADILTR